MFGRTARKSQSLQYFSGVNQANICISAKENVLTLSFECKAVGFRAELTRRWSEAFGLDQRGASN
ncbi:hypothetical protein EGT36_27620 [Agrobacterium sp. FDAARGOS_525]|nr:hypothetical protein EGT36_27620 [Agrobacterium sp. FDAARGOS_525]